MSPSRRTVRTRPTSALSFSGSGSPFFCFPSSETLLSEPSFSAPARASESPPYHSNYGKPASVYSFADGGRVGGRSPVTASHGLEFVMLTKQRLACRWSQASRP